MTVPSRITLGISALILALALGCRTSAEYRTSADDEVYGVVEDLRARFVADPSAFTIEPNEPLMMSDGERAPAELVECLNIAAYANRDYQTRKERLYLVALDLTFERYLFSMRSFGSQGASLAGTGADSTVGQVDGSETLSRLLGSGARIIGTLGLRLFNDLSSGEGFNVVTDLGLTLTQPLLRGSGKRIVQEPLTQAERNVVYEVRSYERFRRTLAVDVATRVYNILRQGDVVRNEQANIDNLIVLRIRNEELSEAGRLSDIQVDQARQDELTSANRLVVEQQRYETLLDGFKLFLGLPVEYAFAPDSVELERLAAAPPEEDILDEEFLMAVALRERLDYLTALDRVDDAERKLYIAKDSLRAGLALEFDAGISSAEGRPLDFDTDDLDWTLGLNLDLLSDRLAERNVYRAALITKQAVVRAADQLEDQIRVEVRAALRDAAATVETNEIQRGAVTLAERRVESARLMMAAGRADTRDILESQRALLLARNAATRSLIDHRLAVLALWRDVEALRVDETGIALKKTVFEPGDVQP